MKKRLLSLTLIGMLSVSAWAQLQLNGIAEYLQLNKVYYLGALYLSEPASSNEAILASNSAQEMVLRIVVKHWPAKRFAKVWRQDIALNNDLAANPELTKHLLAFSSFLREDLLSGDEITIAYDPERGSTVALNGQTVIKHSGKAFFNALLRCWIGEVPYSQRFQKDLLNASGSDKRQQRLQTVFDATIIAANRQNLVAGWLEQDKQVQIELAKAEE